MFVEKIITRRCDKCNKEGRDNRFAFDQYEGCYLCPDCGAETEVVGVREPNWVSIALYEIERAYGGPEEGGWYYDKGRREIATIRNFEVDTPEGLAEATTYFDAMRAKHEIPVSKRRWDEPAMVVKCFSEEMALISTPRHIPVYC